MFFIPSPNLGSSKLAQHKMQDIHINAARASVNQSSIVASMSLNDDVETQKLKATFFQVLRIVMDGGSFLAKRQRLTVVSEAAQSRENNISNIIVDNMFKK